MKYEMSTDLTINYVKNIGRYVDYYGFSIGQISNMFVNNVLKTPIELCQIKAAYL